MMIYSVQLAIEIIDQNYKSFKCITIHYTTKCNTRHLYILTKVHNMYRCCHNHVSNFRPVYVLPNIWICYDAVQVCYLRLLDHALMFLMFISFGLMFISLGLMFISLGLMFISLGLMFISLGLMFISLALEHI